MSVAWVLFGQDHEELGADEKGHETDTEPLHKRKEENSDGDSCAHHQINARTVAKKEDDRAHC